ncbi:MAG: biotin--[acetyl-CoA-carboxylase] ligase [Dehalococcoidia bacterium]|nr:biotin--[acetyl-CoA-carboxylase] ligase [Dehalococcoidia bacterium]
MRVAQSEGLLDAAQVQLNLGTEVVGRRVVCLDKVGSTMDVARAEAEAGAPDGTVIVAEEQTAGRGRFQRAWLSPRGQDLLFSVIFRPRLTQLPLLNMAATLAIAHAASTLAGLHPAVKWPNDVRVDGKKLCGILLEDVIEAGELKHAVVGIGLNVNMDASRYPEIASIATSLAMATGRRFSRLTVLRAVLQELDRLYVGMQRGMSPFADWRASLETLGKRVQVRWQETMEEGVATDVDAEGNLFLTRDDGTFVKLVAGEVTLQA